MQTEHARGFKALAHPLRLRILAYIRERACLGHLIEGASYWVEADERSCQKELASKFDLPLSTLAHHLRLLCDGGLVKVRKLKSLVSLGVDEDRLTQLSQYLLADRKPHSWLEPPGPSANQLVLNDVPPGHAVRPAQPQPEHLSHLMQRMRLRYFGGRGGVDYWGLARSPEFAECQRLVWGLRHLTPSTLQTHNEAVAFWLNLYNLLFLHAVVKLGIQRSVSEIEAVGSHVAYLVGGQVLSAADIEHGILRCNRRATHHPAPRFGPDDPRLPLVLARLDLRVHFAMVCGTRSCPAVAAYSPELLDSQLDVATVSYLNSEVQVVAEERALILPMMFNWYREDFEEHPGGLIAFLLCYLPADERRIALQGDPDIEVRFKEWDCRLNRVER